jgi:hypothetical protein
MNDTALRALVEAGIATEREFKAAETKLKGIKRQLAAEAESRADEHLPTDGGGASWTFEAGDGSAARVTFPAPKLKAAINPESKDGGAVMGKLRKWKDDLFTEVTTYRPVEKFREKVRALLDKRTADTVLKKCESASDPTVSFETVDRSERKEAA